MSGAFDAQVFATALAAGVSFVDKEDITLLSFTRASAPLAPEYHVITLDAW